MQTALSGFNMFDKILFLFLVLSPLCYQAKQDLFIFADRFLMMGTVLLGSFCLLFYKPKRVLLPKWPVWLLIFSIYKLYTLPYHPLSMHAVLNILFGIGIFYLVTCFAEDIRWLYRAVGVVVLVNAIYVISQMAGFSPIFTSQSLSGFFVNNSDLAGYLVLAMPLCAGFGKGTGFFLPLILAGFLQSYTAIICGAISGFLITVRRGLYPLLTILIVGICVLGFMKQSFSPLYKIKYRFLHWKAVVETALMRPVAGNGLGRAIEVTANAQGGGWFNAKNEYLEFGWEVGILPALVFIIYLFRELILRYRKAIKSWDLTLISISLLSFALAMIVQSHLRNPKIAPTVMAVLGFFYVLTEKQKEEI